MASHSSILAWEIPWTKEPGRLQYSPGGHRVRYNLATKQQQSTCTSFKPLKISQDVILLSITCFEGTGYAAGYHLAFLL